MDVKKLILAKIRQKGSVKAAEIIKITGFSRTYINRFLQELKEAGEIIAVGGTNRLVYVLPKKECVENIKKKILSFRRIFNSRHLKEDEVLAEIKRRTGIFIGLKKNVGRILDFSFSEMLNNAIEHSRSPKILVKMERTASSVFFIVEDRGIGVFNSIRKKFNLPDEMSALGMLVKGKQTTDPVRHTGQGIFFTSKMADLMTIASGEKKLVFDNEAGDVFPADRKRLAGTRVAFNVRLNSRREPVEIFNEFTAPETFEFDKTSVRVKLFKNGANPISRSEARRILSGLEKFKRIILDFRGVETVGQGFADEVFRVWKNQHPDSIISCVNTNKIVEMMMKIASS